MSIKDRLEALKGEMSWTKFARFLGIRSQELDKYLRTQKPSSKLILIIKEKFPNLSLDWLVTGKGDMYIQEKHTYIPRIEVHEDYAKYTSNMLDALNDLVPIRLLEDLSALAPGACIALEKTFNFIYIPKKELSCPAWGEQGEDRIVCFSIKDVSMEPTLTLNSIVAVDLRDTTLKSNKIYAIYFPEEKTTTLKRIEVIKDFVLIKADNQNTPGFPKIVEIKKAKEYNMIRARVIWAWIKL